jgi:hypothetical protein
MQCVNLSNLDDKSLPRIKDYRDLPYLYVAAGLFLSFMGDDDTALAIMRHAKPKFKDARFLNLFVRLAYFQGEPVAYSLPALEEMRTTARSHLDTIEREEKRCQTTGCLAKDRVLAAAAELKKRERNTELYAMNMATYIVSEDLARGVKSAAPYQATVANYAAEIRKAADEPENHDDRDAYLDTYAYFTLVDEATKNAPDAKKLEEAVRLLQRVVESQERDVNDAITKAVSEGRTIDRRDLTYLRISRTHLATARELAGE